MNNHEKPERGPLKVFISYAHESIELTGLILALSHRLRSDGFDCSIDQYEDSPDIGWPRWMEKQIRSSDFVIVVCTKEYLNRLQNLETDGGSGVKWESYLIFQDLYDSNSINEKFIPIVFYEEDIQYIPKPLKGSTYYHLFEDFDYRLLYMRLRGIKNIEKPDLGPISQIPFNKFEKLIGKNTIIKEDWDKAGWQGVAFLWYEGLNVPVLSLAFQDEEYARKIFTEWKSRFGREDLNDSVHLSVIKYNGDNKEKRYIVIIGTNVNLERQKLGSDKENTVFLVDARSIDVENIDNYDGWKKFEYDFQKNGFFVLCPAVVDEKWENFNPISDCEIIKRHITISTELELPNNSFERSILDGSRKKQQDQQKD